MNFIGIVALIINLIGVIIVGIGLYYMYQDVNSTSTRSTFWTAAGVGILLLGMILMIMAIIFKGNDQKRAKEKVDKRVDVVKKAVVANEIETRKVQQIEAQQAQQLNQQAAQQQARYNECGDLIQEPIVQYVQAPQQVQQQAPREIVYISPDLVSPQPVIVEAGRSYEDKKQDKEIKKLNNSLQELGRKLEGNGNRDREREIVQNYKAQRKDQDRKIDELRNELKTVQMQRNNKIEEKKIERKVEKRMARQGIIPPHGSIVVGDQIVPNAKHMFQTAPAQAVIPYPANHPQQQVVVGQDGRMYRSPAPVLPYPAQQQVVPYQQPYANQFADAFLQNLPQLQQAVLDPNFINANAAALGNAANAIGAIGGAVGQVRNARAAPLSAQNPFTIESASPNESAIYWQQPQQITASNVPVNNVSFALPSVPHNVPQAAAPQQISYQPIHPALQQLNPPQPPVISPLHSASPLPVQPVAPQNSAQKKMTNPIM